MTRHATNFGWAVASLAHPGYAYAVAGRIEDESWICTGDSDNEEPSRPFTITRSALNRHIISSVVYNWLKHGPTSQHLGHLSASLTGPEGREKFLKSFK